MICTLKFQEEEGNAIGATYNSISAEVFAGWVVSRILHGGLLIFTSNWTCGVIGCSRDVVIFLMSSSIRYI